jgi:hypothetical protein
MYALKRCHLYSEPHLIPNQTEQQHIKFNAELYKYNASDY